MKTFIKILISIILAIVIISAIIITTIFIVKKNSPTKIVYIHTIERDTITIENEAEKSSTTVTESVEIKDTVKTDTITKERVGFSDKVMLYDDKGIQYSLSIDKITKQDDGTYRFELHIYMTNATRTNYGFTYESVFMNGNGNTQLAQTLVLKSTEKEDYRNVNSDTLIMNDDFGILDFTMKCFETEGSGKVLFRNHYIIFIDYSTDKVLLKLA